MLKINTKNIIIPLIAIIALFVIIIVVQKFIVQQQDDNSLQKIIEKQKQPSYLTEQEKIESGIRKELKVEAVQRDENGKVRAHKIIQDPDNPDTDNDWLFDYEEKELGTDPNNWDTDGDGMSDSLEIKIGCDPLQKSVIDKREGCKTINN